MIYEGSNSLDFLNEAIWKSKARFITWAATKRKVPLEDGLEEAMQT